jgi:hypothetical protein
VVDISDFLKDTQSLDGVDFEGATGVRAVRIAGVVAGTIATTLFIGIARVIDAITGAFAGVFDAVAGFVVDTPAQWVGDIGQAVTTDGLGGFGIAALPAAALATLAGLYLADRGFEIVREELL